MKLLIIQTHIPNTQIDTIIKMRGWRSQYQILNHHILVSVPFRDLEFDWHISCFFPCHNLKWGLVVYFIDNDIMFYHHCLEVVVRFVDNDRIVDHHCFNFPFIIYVTFFITAIPHFLSLRFLESMSQLILSQIVELSWFQRIPYNKYESHMVFKIFFNCIMKVKI